MIRSLFSWKYFMLYILCYKGLVKKVIVTAASLAVFSRSLRLSGFSLITKDSATVKGDGATFDLVSNGVWCTADLPGDPVGIPSILEASLNYDALFI